MALYLKTILKRIGVDGAIAFTILSRIIQALGGVVSIIFIAKFLKPDEQGYYYTFASILAIQVFFELGLSGVITQFSAHEFAYLNWNGHIQLQGDEKYKSRLSSLLRFCLKWFGIISIILFFILLAAGYYYFSKFNANLNIEWKKPWIILSLATSMNLFIDPLLAFFDGLGEVKDMALVRLFQKSLNVFLLFVFFALGFKLYSSALASLIAISLNYLQIVFSKRIKMLQAIWIHKAGWVINYFNEIFPYQWRIAVSWISGYFIFQLFNPVLFATSGAKVAGQMGMTIAILTGISSISMSWITTKVPLLSSHIARKDYKKLDDAFKVIFINSFGINIVLISIIVALIQIARYNHLEISNRFLSFVPFVCMALANLANQVIFAFATYLRCHKKEPLLALSIVMGTLVCISTVVLGNKFGVVGITAGYCVLTCFVSLFWTMLVFFRKRKEWHVE